MKRAYHIPFLWLTWVSCGEAYASLESTLTNMQGRLITTILPLAAILGLVFAGFSFVSGSPNAKQHLTLAITGAIIGFAAPSIVAFIQSIVN